MTLPIFILKKASNKVICGCLRHGESSVKLFTLVSPYDIESIISGSNNDVMYVLGMGRKSLAFWRTSLAFAEDDSLTAVATEHFSTPQIERLFSFNSDFSMAAVFLYSFQIFIYQLTTTELKMAAAIDTAGQAVSDAKFHRNIPDILVFVCQDRTFKIWNVSTSTPIFESHVLTGIGASCLALSSFSNQMVLAFLNGMILGYSLIAVKATNSSEIPTSLFQVDLCKKITTFLSKIPASTVVRESLSVNSADDSVDKRSLRQAYFSSVYPSAESQPDKEISVDVQILALFYFTKPLSRTEQLESLNIHGNKHYADDIRALAQHLLILLPCYIVQLNLANLEIERIVALPDDVLTGSFGVFNNSGEPFCIYTTSNAVVIISLNSDGDQSLPLEVGDELSGQLNMIATEGLLPKSVLRTAKIEASVPHEKPPQLYKPVSQLFRQPGSLDKKGKIVSNQPITFHNKIKSSGYAALKPSFSFPKKPPAGRGSNATRSQSSDNKNTRVSDKFTSSSNSYPVTGPPPSELTGVMSLVEHPVGSVWLQPSFDGKSLAFSMTNGIIGVVSTKTMANPRFFVQHRQCVRRVAWSKCGSWVAACSDDGTGSFWSTKTGERVIDLTDEKGQPFTKPNNHIQFYYMDQFVIAAVGNSLNLYSFGFTSEKSDVKRYQVNSVVKRICQLPVENAMAITAANAANTFHSYLAICAGSDHSLNIFDFNSEKCVLKVEEAHPKAAHCIALTADVLANAAVPQSVYNFYATTAIGDVIKLWDVRSGSKPVRCLQGNANRSCPFVGVAFSPCARFLAAGSEDRNVYLFDIRADRPLSRLDGGVSNNTSVKHSDTVTCVAFNPTKPQLYAATLDGNLYRYETPHS